MGLSPLRYNLFTHTIIDNRFCEACGLHMEDAEHFFSVGPAYKNQRAIRLHRIDDIVLHINSLNICNVIDIDNLSVILELLTSGVNFASRSETDSRNKHILHATTCFLLNTKRFFKKLD